MTRTTLLLVIILSACSTPDAFDVDSRVSVEFDAAAELWCEASGCCPYQSSDGDSSVSLESRESINNYCLSDCDGAAVHEGDVTHIRLADDLSKEDLWSVLLHELGHHCGCFDSEDERNVMAHATGARGLSPTESDVACAR
jgi:hypothetical protein